MSHHAQERLREVLHAMQKGHQSTCHVANLPLPGSMMLLLEGRSFVLL